jgi:hypothetical protein
VGYLEEATLYHPFIPPMKLLIFYLSLSSYCYKRDLGYIKKGGSGTQEGPRKKMEEITMFSIFFMRGRIMQKEVPTIKMVITSTRSGPSVHLTITPTFLVYGNI